MHADIIELLLQRMPNTMQNRLRREIDIIRVVKGENPLKFLGKVGYHSVDKTGDQLTMLENSADILQRKPTLYILRKKPILSRPVIPRSLIDGIIRDAYLTDRVAMMQNSMIGGPIHTL